MRIGSLFVVASLALPAAASADILTLWAAGKADYVGGTGGLYDKFDAPFGAGVEGGIELIGIDIWGEALAFGTDQYLFTANVGADLTLGEESRFTIGVFLTPMFFVFPEDAGNATGLNFDALSNQEKQLLQSSGVSLTQIEREYAEYASTEEEAARFSFGLGVPRVQLQFDQHIFGPLYVGLGGEVAYHFVLSGEEAAADQKSKLIDGYADSKDLPAGSADALKKATGAKAANSDDLDGFNWNFGGFLKLEL